MQSRYNTSQSGRRWTNIKITKKKIINISLIMLMVMSFSIFAVYEIKNKGIYLYPENRVTE